MAETKKRDEQIRDAMAELGFNPNDSNIPKSGGSGAIGSIYLPASTTAVPVGDSGYNPGEFKTPDPAKDRVGDYVQSAGGWDVVRNSPTDLANKFLIARASVNSRQNLSLEDFTNAAKVVALGSMGLPTNFSSAGDAIGTGVGAQLAKAGGAGAGWGLLQGVQSLLAADKAYEDAYLSQNFDFDIGLKLFKDEAGNTRFLPDYAKMAQTGTPGESGSMVQNMLSTESTGVYMSADNKLNIDVSPVFAESAAYKQLLRQIKDTYGSLTKEQANSIADQDTGATVLDTISNLVKFTESQYFYNTQMGRAIKNYAPTASDEAMNIALSTSKIGHLGDKVLKSIDVQVYDDSNKLVKVNAKKYLDSIQSMDKIGRNNYMSKIESRLNDSNISDNEKAVLYAQANALRSASDSDGSYHGMYQRDWLDEIGSTTDPVFGLTWNTYFGGTDLDTFRRDEISAGLLDLGGTFASVKALTGITNINESLIRALPGARNVSRYAGESFAEAQKLATDASSNVARQALSTGLRTGTQVGFQLAADAVYDAVKAIPYALTGNDYDFKEELENDFMMDMLVTYGPRNFAEKASASKMEYRVAAENTKTGKIEYVRPSDIKNKDNYRILSDEVGMRDSKLVEVTSEELSKRRAATIAKLEDNKIVQSIQKNFFDKNAAFGKLAMQVKAVSDVYHYRKFMRNGAASIESITKDVMREWKNQDGVKNAWKELGTALKAAGVKGGIFRPKGLSQADNDYLKAVINETRFLGIHKDDKEKQARTKKFYAEGKKGVSKERAQELNNVLKAMQQVSAKILDFYQKKGLMSEKQIAKLRAAPGYENGFVPVYTVPGSSISGEVSQNRALLKRVKNADVYIALKDLENPLESIARYINNAMRAVAVNDRALAVREAATLNGVGIRVIKDDGGSLKEYKNLKATDKAFNMIYVGISKEVRASLPTFEEWQKANDQRVLRSNALKTAEKVRELRDEAKALYNENRRLQRQIKKIERGDVIVVDGKDYAKNVTADNTRNIEGYKQFAADHMERVPDTVLDKDVEDFALHVIRPGGDVDMYNSYLRGGDYKDTKDWARQYIDDVEDMYADEIEDLAFKFFPSDAEKIAKDFEVDFNEKGYWDTMIKYQDALKDMMADKLLQATKGNYKLNDSAIFYRGVSTEGNSVNKGGDFSWLKEGGKFKDDGFGFISLSDVVAKNYASHGSGDKYVLEYHIPAGQRMFYFGGIEKGGGDGGAFVLPAGVTGKVGKISNMGDGVKKVEIFIDSNKKDFSAATKKQYERIFDKIHVNRTLIADNKQQQLGYIDDIRRYTKNLMERAQKAHKGSNLKLDIDSYTNVQVMNALKDALKSENTVGKVQKMLNKAVERANPWVDPEDVIRRRAEAAAVNYRKKVVKDIKEQEKERLGAKGINMDKVNALADKVMDKITKKIKGERDTEVTYIDTDDGMPKTEILTNYDRPNVIRYYLDGEMHTMVLEGKGAEELVAEFYAPEFVAPKTIGGHILHGLNTVSKGMAQAKRYLTTAADFARVLPNILRDWSRGIVSTGGQILLSPDKFFKDMQVVYGYSDEQIKLINNGLMLCHEDLRNSTLTASLQMPRKNREKEIIRSLVEPDGNAFVRFVYDFKHVRVGKILSSLQDMAETFTRQRAMDTAYYKTLSDAQSRGKSVDDSIKEATEAAYFAGREATVNFRRRGAIIERFAQNVPYLTQRFATLESFKYSYVNDPIGFTRALTSTVSAYTAMIAIALSNDESKKKYMMLSEYDRANNIIIPIDNSAIITIPLDDTIAAFLTPYRRMVETLNSVDPEAFYLCFAEALEALNPMDFSGFSEGDGFNVARGFDKLEAEFVPTWAQPFLEMWKGRDLYYGTNLRIDSDYTGMMNDNWTPTLGELTTKGKNSQMLAMVADHTGIPQWILQNFLAEYGGNVGQYVLNTIDKLGGATQEAQGGKEWIDSVFKPFTGGDSDQATSDFYNIVNGLKEDKVKLQNEVKTLTAKINKAGGNDKAELIKERQKKIMEYGLHVTDAIENYLSAYEITGGLSKKLANQAWYLYKIYDEESNSDLSVENSTGDYYTDKASAWNYKQANALAAESGFDKFVHHPVSDYYDSYAEQAFKQTSYGDSAHYIAEIEDILNKSNINRSEMYKNYNNMTSAQKKQWKAAWNKKVVKALAPYIQETGVENVLDQRKVVDYLDEVIFVSNPWNTKQYLKKIFGGK